MAALGIPKGALLVIDRSLYAKMGDFVIIKHEGEFLCRLLVERGGKQFFSNGITDIAPIPGETCIEGVVSSFTYIFRKHYDHAH